MNVPDVELVGESVTSSATGLHGMKKRIGSLRPQSNWPVRLVAPAAAFDL
jgi:hypothetical protein